MQVVFHEAARDDLNELIDYVSIRAGQIIADKQLERVQSAFATIGQFPRASRYHHQLDVYESWLPRTRFIVFYRILASAELVVVLAIIDHAQNTTRTKTRLIRSRS